MDGLVDVCFDGTFSSVCITGWSVEEASVVCRQLGFSTGWATGNVYKDRETIHLYCHINADLKRFHFYFVVLFSGH